MGKFLSWLLLALLAVGCAACAPAAEEAVQQAGNEIAAYADRYAAYARKHPELTREDVLVYVNLRLDLPNYEGVVTWCDTGALTLLVNKQYALPKSYRPESLTAVDKKYAKSGVLLRDDCYAAFLSMAQAAKEEGLQLYIHSGYRVNRKRGGPDSPWYAWPGHSEHQTGLAFDLCKKGVSYRTLSEYRYHRTREYEWLREHAHAYGFVLSYPQERTSITGFGFEPWHWRYIGVEAAADMREKGCETFQEYWAKYLIRQAIAREERAGADFTR